jgi:hypothetical protein
VLGAGVRETGVVGEGVPTKGVGVGVAEGEGVGVGVVGGREGVGEGVVGRREGVGEGVIGGREGVAGGREGVGEGVVGGREAVGEGVVRGGVGVGDGVGGGRGVASMHVSAMFGPRTDGQPTKTLQQRMALVGASTQRLRKPSLLLGQKNPAAANGKGQPFTRQATMRYFT